MSESAPETHSDLTQADVSAAEAAEQAALSASQNSYLLRRVVVLRAQLNRTMIELDFARKEIERLNEPKTSDQSGE